MLASRPRRPFVNHPKVQHLIDVAPAGFAAFCPKQDKAKFKR